MRVQRRPTCSNMLDQKCWTRLRTMWDDVGSTFFLQKILNENLKQFKHLSNILLLISCVRWCWMRVSAFPTCWTNIHAKKMSISLKLKRFNVQMSILLWIEFHFWMFWILYVLVIRDIIILLSNKMEFSSEDVRQIKKLSKKMNTKVWSFLVVPQSPMLKPTHNSNLFYNSNRNSTPYINMISSN